MTVYVLYVSDWEKEWISGIYSTYEKCEEARKMISSRFNTWIEAEKVQ